MRYLTVRFKAVPIVTAVKQARSYLLTEMEGGVVLDCSRLLLDLFHVLVTNHGFEVMRYEIERIYGIDY